MTRIRKHYSKGRGETKRRKSANYSGFKFLFKISIILLFLFLINLL